MRTSLGGEGTYQTMELRIREKGAEGLLMGPGFDHERPRLWLKCEIGKRGG